MSKFKVGDEVILLSFDSKDEWEKKYGGVIGNKYVVDLNTSGESKLIKIRPIDFEDGFYVDAHQIKFADSFYITSNRNKLREHIKSLGFTAIDLSVAAGFNRYYFGSETGESRFNKRGDISDKRFNELKALASSAKDKLSNKSIGKLTIDLEVKTTFVSDQSKELIEKLTHNQNAKIEKLKSKWIVSNKVFFTFLFIVSLLILFIVTGVVKQVF